MIRSVFIFLVFAVSLASCKKDGGSNVKPSPKLKVPETYAFSRNGSSSVSFSGQTTRLKMLTELSKAMKNPAKTEAQLKAMFDHKAKASDFSDAALNASSKSVKSKIAASSAYFSTNTTASVAIKAKFDSFISTQAKSVFPKWDVDASAGKAGKLQQSGGGRFRYVNEKGIEMDQALAKAAIGALVADQILNNYLSTNVLDAGTNKADNNAGKLAGGKNYTTMEHKWDEAYGYLYGMEENPAVPNYKGDAFLNKYLGRVDQNPDFKGVAKEIYEAFKTGRAAIVAQDYTLRDKQIDILREKISKVIAIRTVHYLESGKSTLATDKASAFHDLSEAYGFMQSLRFTHNPKTGKPHLDINMINAFIEIMEQGKFDFTTRKVMPGNGLWDIQAPYLDYLSKTIATAYGFTVAQAAK